MKHDDSVHRVCLLGVKLFFGPRTSSLLWKLSQRRWSRRYLVTSWPNLIRYQGCKERPYGAGYYGAPLRTQNDSDKSAAACRRKCSGKASLINSNVLAACAILSHFCEVSFSPSLKLDLSHFYFPPLFVRCSWKKDQDPQSHWESWQNRSES